MDSKVSGVTHRAREETLASIDKIPVDTQPEVCLTAEELLTITAKVSVRVKQTYGAM